MRISARNQLQGTVTGSRRGEAIGNVELDVAGQRLTASITIEPWMSSDWTRENR
jgi:molybdopterin-binding protein